ncbi:ABC transporter permease [Kosakonia sacchari]|uniref:ABC transporter permease n=1 Tax=Kosakonia sacchari TaxID=1158459 RepID=UPI003F566E33
MFIHRNNIKLIIDLTKRDIISKYKGSLFGFFWSIITPLMLLLVYSFVFGTIFKSRWAGMDDSKANFAIVLFIGMLTYNIFSDSISRSPWLISGNANYVKKVIFPITILPIVNVLSAIYNFAMGFIAWLIIVLILGGTLHLTVILLPVAVMPVILMSLGGSWLFSALGVYFKDVGQFISVFVMILMFSCPIFYPITAVPEKYQFIFHLNPIAMTIEMVRDITIFGRIPSISTYANVFITSLLIASVGLLFFKKCRGGFSDVL